MERLLISMPTDSLHRRVFYRFLDVDRLQRFGGDVAAWQSIDSAIGRMRSIP